MEIREGGMHLIYVRLNIFFNKFALKSRTESCVMIKGNLLLKIFMGLRLDIVHDFLIGLSIGKWSFVLIGLFLKNLFQQVEFLVEQVFFCCLLNLNHSIIIYDWYV